MPKALTPIEKAARVNAKINATRDQSVSPDTTPRPQIRKAAERPIKESRGIFNGTRGKLKISDSDVQNFAEAGWSLHIFNDVAGRIEEALQDGWEFVERSEIGSVVANVVDGNTDVANKVRFRVGRLESGEGMFAYLMKLPTVSYIENQKKLQRRNDVIDAAIRSGKNVKAGDSPEGFYDAGIAIKRE